MTFEDAARRQVSVWRLVKTSQWDYAEEGDPRFASLHPDYYETHRTDMGHSVNILTEELCKGEFKWDETGTVLLCDTCFTDGTRWT